MSRPVEFERCQAFINCQLQSPRDADAEVADPRRWRAITISRQTGCGAREIADGVVAYLRSHAGRGDQPWMVFDRNLVEKVLEDHNLPAKVAEFITEDRISELDDIIEESFGLHPSRWVLVRKTSETILHLAYLGNVILIGRGANVVTRKLPRVFHVRLIGSLERRVERLREEHPQGEKAALKFLRTEDNARRRYLKKYFGKDADDPMLYHLVINTDLISPETAAVMIGNAVMERDPVTVH